MQKNADGVDALYRGCFRLLWVRILHESHLQPVPPRHNRVNFLPLGYISIFMFSSCLSPAQRIQESSKQENQKLLMYILVSN